jgi:hypothetical protein
MAHVGTAWRTWESMIFFNLLNFSVPNSFILLTSCDSKFSYRNFGLTLVRGLIQGREGGACTHRPHHGDGLVLQLNRQYSTWNTKDKGTQKEDELNAAHFSKSRGTRTKFRCSKCNLDLRLGPCFRAVTQNLHFKAVRGCTGRTLSTIIILSLAECPQGHCAKKR